jgi:aryl-alcohol dehydrogenase-like predicted oxidoreductase
MTSFLRPLGNTGLTVSVLGLGTVKIGRNTQVKYPTPFDLPDDRTVRQLLDSARELGINLIDTAPAYGNSEERLGKLLSDRDAWVLCTKVGEEFSGGSSHFDFSAKHTRLSIERSLQRLRTDYLDLVLIHSDGNDLSVLEDTDCAATLMELKQQGLIRAIGMSTKTVEGGIAAAQLLDVVMLTWNLQQQDEGALQAAHALGKGVLVKKGLMSGQVQANGKDLVKDSMQGVLMEPGISSMIVGTINPAHLRSNVEIARSVLVSAV